MRRTEDWCVGPCPQGCMGSACPNSNVVIYECDECGDETTNPTREDWYIEDEDLCPVCFREKYGDDEEE